MFFIPPSTLMDDDQRCKWTDIETQLRNLQAASDPADPWLFHGTSQKSAISIVESGFDAKKSYVYRPGPGPDRSGGDILQCAYWSSSVDMALKFATKKAGAETGFPVLFVAKASDLSKAGALVPDYNTREIDCNFAPDAWPTDWKDSLTKLGAIAVVDCGHVPNLQVHCPSGDIYQYPDQDISERNIQAYIIDLMKRDFSTDKDVDEFELLAAMA
jgi:hypothetical protein